MIRYGRRAVPARCGETVGAIAPADARPSLASEHPDLVLISAESLSELWDVTPATVRRWCRAGSVPAIRVGKLWRFRLSDVRRVVEGA